VAVAELVPKANPVDEDGRAGSGTVCPNVKLVECWICSGALKENPDDVASAVFGARQRKSRGKRRPCCPLGVGPNENPVGRRIICGAFVEVNENPLLEPSVAFVFVPKANPPLVP